MWLTIRHGAREFRMQIDFDANDGQEEDSTADRRTTTDGEEKNGGDAANPSELAQMAVPTNLGQLREQICAQTGCDNGTMKLIHKGKYIVAPMERRLGELKLKEGDKVVVIGVVTAPQQQKRKENAGIALLADYERTHLAKLSALFNTNGADIGELERNFLEGDMLDEMLRRMDKRLQEFTEHALRHLESIDALCIYADAATEEEKCRSREKRKCLVDNVQTLLRDNDKLAFRLQQYRTSLLYK